MNPENTYWTGNVVGITEESFVSILTDNLGQKSVAEFDKNLLSEQDKQNLAIGVSFQLFIDKENTLKQKSKKQEIILIFKEKRPLSSEDIRRATDMAEQLLPDSLLD